MLVAASALMAAACVVASARRLAFAVSPARLELVPLLAALEEAPPDGSRSSREPAVALGDLRGAVERCAGATWEAGLLEALSTPDEPTRVALVNEQLGELAWMVQRWGRVPRVCASVATTTGFLCATVTLMVGLAAPDPDARAALFAAVDALAVGMAATAFCVAVHVRARALVQGRLAAADRLVSALLERAGGAGDAVGT